jgi:hypothetical protein
MAVTSDIATITPDSVNQSHPTNTFTSTTGAYDYQSASHTNIKAGSNYHIAEQGNSSTGSPYNVVIASQQTDNPNHSEVNLSASFGDGSTQMQHFNSGNPSGTYNTVQKTTFADGTSILYHSNTNSGVTSP